MLCAIEIVPRNPKLLQPQEHTLGTLTMSETSLGKGKNSKVKMEEESGEEIDDSDEDCMKEKALLVRF